MTNFALVVRNVIIHYLLLRFICLNSRHRLFLVSIFLILFPLKIYLLNFLSLVLLLPVIFLVKK